MNTLCLNLPAVVLSLLIFGHASTQLRSAPPRMDPAGASLPSQPVTDFEVRHGREQGDLTILRNGEPVWILGQMAIAVHGPADYTGNSLPNLLIHEAPSRSLRTLHLLELAPDGISTIWNRSGPAQEMRVLFDDLVHKIQSGARLSDLSGTNEYLAQSVSLENGATPKKAPPGSLFSIQLEDDGKRLLVMKNDEEIWRFESWMITYDPPADLTGNGVENLLISYARSRSFRGFILVELDPEDVNVLWELETHASDAQALSREIHRRIQAGESLAKPPRVGRGGDLDALLAAPGLTPPAPPAEPASLQNRVAALGYVILTGEAAAAIARTISVQWHGEEVWGLRAMMASYELREAEDADRIELVVEARETRRAGTLFILELGAEGLTVLETKPAQPTGIQLPQSRY